MISGEDIHLRLLNTITSNPSSVIKYSEPRNESPPSTRITIVSDSILSNSPISPLRKSDQSVSEYDHRQTSTPRVSFKPLSMSAISRQFGVRKTLQKQL
jgi:hypothetical protein